MIVQVCSKQNRYTPSRQIQILCTASQARMRARNLERAAAKTQPEVVIEKPVEQTAPETKSEPPRARRKTRRERTNDRNAQRLTPSTQQQRINLARNKKAQRARTPVEIPSRPAGGSALRQWRATYAVGLEHAADGAEYAPQINDVVQTPIVPRGGIALMTRLKWDRYVVPAASLYETRDEREYRLADLARWKKRMQNGIDLGKRAAETGVCQPRPTRKKKNKKNYQEFLNSGVQYRMTWLEYKRS
jgi:hypothetical protein